jgi:hypothetical protein
MPDEISVMVGLGAVRQGLWVSFLNPFLSLHPELPGVKREDVEVTLSGMF